ncbi:hypothetical protein AB0F30_20015 [Streptomyces sp. NPDC029006]|uniref:hypothetical protein n=1 Tax=Streptomyces sp. NPDC029006 TaxID=3155467 RepID=UPI0033F99AE6
MAHDPMRLAVDGYVLRIRCDTDSTGRRVMIGTQTREGVRRFTLDECRLLPWGLSTPAVEEVRRLRGTVRRIGTTAARRAEPGPGRAARPVAAFQAREDRTQAFAALRQAIEQGRSASALRHCLTHAEATAHGGASAEENELLRQAADLLLRTERGVGVSAPPTSSSRQRGRLSPRDPRPARSTASPGRKAAEAVADLLDTLDRRRGDFHPGEQQRLVARLGDKARQAAPWLTPSMRKKIRYWRQRTPQAPLAPKQAMAPSPSLPASTATVVPEPARKRRVPQPRQRQEAPASWSRDIDLVADAARDVLEHAARLGKTLPWEQLCAQAQGLSDLSEDAQRRVLRKACARSRAGQPLAALVTTSSGMPHPHYRHLARQPGVSRAVLAAWHQAVSDVHASYRPGPPPPGAQPATT